MKVKYFAIYDGNPYSGVNNKIFKQASSLINLGIDVELILVGGTECIYPSYDFIVTKTINELNACQNLGVLNKLRRQYKIHKIFKEIDESSGQKDIIYLRYPFPIFCGIALLLGKYKNSIIITEHNTIESTEFILIHNYLSFLFDLFFGGIIRRRSEGIVGVTDEITQYEINKTGDPLKPHITIGNGIDVQSMPVRNPGYFTGKELNLLCVSSVSPWHGLDRLIRGLSEYSSDTRVRFHIVGVGVELQNLKNLAKDHSVENLVIYHGFLSGAVLDEIFDQCHLAIGSLGIHRKGLKTTSEIKIREYIARGIPFICSSSDPDIPEDFPYFMKVPADDSAIDIEKIVDFTEKIYSDPLHHRKMREYAIETLDWSVKMKRLKNFCESLVNHDN